MSGRGFGPALKIVLRFGAAYAVIYLLWSSLREGFVRVLSTVALRVLRLIEHPPIITGLVPRGDALALHSYVTGAPEPFGVWHADNLHVFVIASIALALAVPLKSRSDRLRQLASSIVIIGCVTVAICVVHVKVLVERHAAGYLKMTLHTTGEKVLLEWADRGLVMVGMLLLPAYLFMQSYASLSDASEPAAGRTRRKTSDARVVRVSRGRRVVAVTVAFGVGLGALAAFLQRAPTADDYLDGLTRLKAMNPGSAYASFRLGMQHEQAGRVHEALSLYEEALRLDPDLIVARVGMGNALFSQGRFAEAVPSYEEALRREHGNISARRSLGDALLGAGDYDRATREYQEVLQQRPRDGVAHRNLAIALLRLGRPCEGLPHLESAAVLDSRSRADPGVRQDIARLRPVCREPEPPILRRF